MKLFSTLNKPAIKDNNKQAGIVFLEYVIIAFIATVAVICSIWWFYWHLQQLTWEIKDRLNNLPRTCPLEKPGGPANEQPTSQYFFEYSNISQSPWGSQAIPFTNQKVTVKNNGTEADTIHLNFIDDTIGVVHSEGFELYGGQSKTYTYKQEGPGPYKVQLTDIDAGPFTVTIVPN
jgi:hypothetical protein